MSSSARPIDYTAGVDRLPRASDSGAANGSGVTGAQTSTRAASRPTGDSIERVPSAPEERTSRQPVIASPVSTIDEAPASAIDAARFLVAGLQHHGDGSLVPSRLGFTSALSGEGVTFISHTVAAVIAHDFRNRVCVIDLNWGDKTRPTRRRSRAGRSKVEEQDDSVPGLADALRRDVPIREAIRETDDPRLTVVSAGVATEREGQVFARSDELALIIRVLERHNDHLIFDLPPVLSSSATPLLARQAEAVGLVVRYGVTTEAQVRSAFERLGAVPSAGVVLNRSTSKIPRPLLRRLSTW